MKKSFFAAVVILLFLSSCEIEVRDGVTYHHHRGYEHEHYPEHHEEYHHGYHHDRDGGEIIIHP